MKVPKGIYVLLLCCSFIVSSLNAEEPNDNLREKTDVPRVRIKVFRGPDQEEMGQKYAFWGFWVKQPSG